MAYLLGLVLVVVSFQRGVVEAQCVEHCFVRIVIIAGLHHEHHMSTVRGDNFPEHATGRLKASDTILEG